ncbi:MAG: protein translocase subunit SecF [Chlorobium sp.]|jgi:preprotein translocase subunit SecF|uniref:protein translocase subunit SecF n=1 Tax=Chlorobium sp. TaxID=1095 RepID=UPI001D2AED08|nr:protein translocase subunit SecF [Chlorobium sp.]MBN1278329.1 protein translocase subunit SecF [Chlorobiaceae bacterium]MCF8216891.1 protein translocase subunit SecF [Chlorobium sp.]MCF8271720.1 protein translocase subunit SecF [Chlorobium sp.]MCF8288108.1 protein translocase subunit SecF [Chlorobium sp.]MCF8291699.1 protein translocase subunit SecF [Chlorobium sp.]
MKILHKTDFDFLKYRKITYGISIALLLAGMISLVFKGLNYGIDFRGGSDVVVRFEKNVDVGSVRTVLKDAGISGTLKQYGMDRSFLLSTVFSGETNELKALITNALKDRLPDNEHEIVRIDSVGPSIASDMKWSALKALFAALAAILLYVGIRFELKFATAGVIAIFHDVFFILGMFSILGGVFTFMPLEMDQSIIAAFLTVAGYSVTDTVVVYDRIRERIRGRKPSEYEAIFNESMNQTLTRTVITSGTTMITVLILFIFAGPAIRGFAFAVFAGILIGTYSSLFIAVPIVYDWLRLKKSAVKLRGGSAS